MPEKTAVLFVCLGNICRSTMAEGIFRHLVKQGPYHDLIGTIDSCGTGAYHIGSDPDDRTMSTLKLNGITDYTHAARMIRPADFDKFDYIFAMDRENLSVLEQYKKLGPSPAKVMLFGEYSGTCQSEVVKDPYYGGQGGFDAVYEQCWRFSKNFLGQTFPEVGRE